MRLFKVVAVSMALVFLRQGFAAGAQAPQDFVFSKKRPRLVVLVHGVTSEPRQAPEEYIGTSLHPRIYWGRELIQGLMGFPDDEEARILQPNVTGFITVSPLKSNKDWSRDADYDVRNGDLAPVLFPVSWNKADPAAINKSQKEVQTYIRLMNKVSSNPLTSVMVNFRDGSTHLMPQAGAAIDQIYDTYQKVFGKLAAEAQPQIYFVGHSFGGVIARTIFTNPTGGDLWGNKLTAKQREKADFLRARTVLLATLSSPHRGTLIGIPSGDVARFVRKAGKTAVVAFRGFDTLFAQEPLKRLDLPKNMATKATELVGFALDKVAGERDCLADLTRMDEYNQGILQPDLARRGEGKSKIPIYTMNGRSPGATYFDRVKGPVFVSGRWLPNSILDIKNGDEHATNALALYAINAVLHEEGYGPVGMKPWGTTAVPETDLFTSAFKGYGPGRPRAAGTPFMLTNDNVTSILGRVLHGYPYRYGPDGENDSDGFLDASSGHGVGLQGGAWYRVYRQDYYGQFQPWDYDNHDTIRFNVGNGIWIHNELLRQAGPMPSPGRFSTYPMIPAPPAPKRNISVQVVAVTDTRNNLDTATQADFSIEARVAGVYFSQKGPDNEKVAKGWKSMSVSNLPNSVVPIMLSVFERDTPDPDDYCTICPKIGQDNLYLYLDTRTGRIYGDVRGEVGETFSATGKGSDNVAKIEFKVTMS